MKVYLSGPMTGIANHNKAAFDEAATTLRSWGHEVISPVELDGDEVIEGTGWEASDLEYEGYMARDLALIPDVDAVVMIHGWPTSGGAGREGRKALELGIKLYTYASNGLVELPAWLFLQYSTVERRRPPVAAP